MNTKTKKVALLGLCVSLAMVLSYLELLIPPIYSAVPGIKMGLPNIVIIFTLYRFGLKEAAAVSFVRILAVSLLFGNFFAFAYSLAGATLSLAVMAILKKTDAFSQVGVSVVGAVCHNLAQTAVAIFLLERIEIGYYMAILTVTGVLAGILVGLAAAYLIKILAKVKF
jgi:heptaprenyl diphosphate synthase